MKQACIILTVMILISLVAICVMVKFATDITVEERTRTLSDPQNTELHVNKPMGIFSFGENYGIDNVARFPYVAAITRNISSSWIFTCFGSLILDQWIITSAHCKKEGSIHKALLYSDFAKNVSFTYSIIFWRIHDLYNLKNPSARYDIAVAKLNVASFGYPLKVSSYSSERAGSLEASVWKTVWTMDLMTYLTNDMERYDVKDAEIGRCFENYIVDVDESMICVDLSDHDSCFISEFGPIYEGDRLVGVLAAIPKSCDVKWAIFTNVSFYADWILESTKSLL